MKPSPIAVSGSFEHGIKIDFEDQKGVGHTAALTGEQAKTLVALLRVKAQRERVKL